MFRKWKSSIIKPIQGARLKITSRHDYTLILYPCYTYTRHIHMSILTSVTRSYYFALAVYFLPNVLLETSVLNLEVDPVWKIRHRNTEHLHQHQHLLSRTCLKKKKKRTCLKPHLHDDVMRGGAKIWELESQIHCSVLKLFFLIQDALRSVNYFQFLSPPLLNTGNISVTPKVIHNY